MDIVKLRSPWRVRITADHIGREMDFFWVEDGALVRNTPYSDQEGKNSLPSPFTPDLPCFVYFFSESKPVIVIDKRLP